MDIPKAFVSQKQHESVHRTIDNLFIRIKEKLFPFMRVDAQEKVVENFNGFLNNPYNQNLEQTFIHGTLEQVISYGIQKKTGLQALLTSEVQDLGIQHMILREFSPAMEKSFLKYARICTRMEGKFQNEFIFIEVPLLCRKLYTG